MLNHVKTNVILTMSILLGLTLSARPQSAAVPPAELARSDSSADKSPMQVSARQAFMHVAANGTLADPPRHQPQHRKHRGTDPGW
ncbi:MAG: hypothetical protein WCT05_03040 [Lentisphaeria bacterium]